MKYCNLLILLIGAIFSLSLVYATLINNSAWATVAITGILAIITAYYAISTEEILRVTALYARTTEGLLEVNRKTLNQLIIEKRSKKVAEITKTILIPLDGRIKLIKEWMKRAGIVIIDLTQNRVKIHSLNYDIQFSTTLDYINSQFKTLNIDENYDEPIFKRHVSKILEFIKEYDKEQKGYEDFIETSIPLFFPKIASLFKEKMGDSSISALSNQQLYISLMIGKPDPSIKKIYSRFDSINDDEYVLNKFSHFIDDCNQNNMDFRTFREKNAEYEKRLIEKLELLETELHSLQFGWMDVYHTVINNNTQ